MEEVKEVNKPQKVSCWCGCGQDAYIIVMGLPLCLECGRQHFRANRLVREAVEA